MSDSSFNGAALFQVRKLDGFIGEAERQSIASMGPHFFKCGNKQSKRIRCAADRRFNGAALFQVRKRACQRRLSGFIRHASMGPHFFKCGNKTRSSLGWQRVGASMGPHFFKCGNVCSCLKNVLWKTASMGPHFFKCGNCIVDDDFYDENYYCFNGAALFQVRKRDALQGCLAIKIIASMGPHFFKCGNSSQPSGA